MGGIPVGLSQSGGYVMFGPPSMGGGMYGGGSSHATQSLRTFVMVVTVTLLSGTVTGVELLHFLLFVLDCLVDTLAIANCQTLSSHLDLGRLAQRNCRCNRHACRELYQGWLWWRRQFRQPWCL